MPKITDLGLQMVAKRGPKADQNRTKNRTKINAKNEPKKTPLQDRPGTVCGRSWAVLWPLLGSSLLILYWVLKLFVKVHFVQKLSCQEPSWAQLGPSWVDFGLQKRPMLAPQNGSKAIKKTTWKISRSWSPKMKKNLTQLWTESGAFSTFAVI